MDTIEILFPGVTGDHAEILIAQLSLLCFESFWESDEGLRAYIAPADYSEEALADLIGHYGVSFQKEVVTVAEWSPAEADHRGPVLLAGGSVYIHGAGEAPNPAASVNVAIDVKLSFGSGHHPSTALCVEWIMQQTWQQERVLDVGTGSGILALAAACRTQGAVLGYDNNPWAVQVARHNAALNSQLAVQFVEASPESFPVADPWPVVLANLNEQVIPVSLAALLPSLAVGGDLVLSGYQVVDQERMHAVALGLGLSLQQTLTDGLWVASVWQKHS